MILKYFLYWLIAAFMIYTVMEMTHSMTPGQLKKPVIMVLHVVYLPLYVLILPFVIIFKTYEVYLYMKDREVKN